ncbi:MAG: metallophosphoesterase [Nocardioides alkalitolerans]
MTEASSAAAPALAEGRLRRRTARAVTVLGLLAAWVVIAGVVGMMLFLGSSRETVIAGHDAVVRPTLSQYAVVEPGAILPDVRLPIDSPVGVDVRLGKTEAATTEELVSRYAFIASQPDAQIAKVTDLVTDMAISAALRGAVAGAVPVALWLLLGARRRRELVRGAVSRRGLASGTALAVAVALVWQPWDGDDVTTGEAQDEDDTWITLADFLGPEVPLPAEAASLELRSDVTTTQSRRLIESAVSTYDTSLTFYSAAVDKVDDLELRQPEDDETVVVFVTDRHDNIGMDPVARAIGDAAGATAVFDGGDDTSTGQPWEAFSLDSVQRAFSDYDRWSVIGNHDHGDFVGDYLGDLGWVRLDGSVVDGPGDSTLMGIDDPRSSGLGNWRDEPGLTFDEVRDRITEDACASEERINTLLVHDASLGRDALSAGCVDLVIGGHIHVRSGPTPVEGENGEIGYTFTAGTTGGAAYAIAVGSKPRRQAETTLITYRDGRPVGMQWVILQPNGRFDVGEYVPLEYAAGDVEQPIEPTAPTGPTDVVPLEDGDGGDAATGDGSETQAP